ncbi:DUF6263 family protein [Pirellulales bacterium]|nr:DUF6263 family protein [Pirellulales bacterium]
MNAILFQRACGAVLLLSMAIAALPADAQETVPAPRWKFEVGDEHHWRMTQQIDAVQQLGVGGEVKFRVHAVISATWTVVGIDDNDSAIIRQTVRRVTLQVDGPGEQTAKYDTADPESPRGFAARIAPLMQALQDHPLQATMTPRGEIIGVEAPEPLLNQLRAAPGAKKLGDLTTVRAFRDLIEQNAIVLPESGEIAPGDEWTASAKVEMPLLGALAAEKTYRYEEDRDVEGDRYAIITPQVQLTFAADRSDEGSDGAPKVEITKQESSGEVVFNRTAGRLQSTDLNQSLDINYAAGDQSADQHIEQVVTTIWSENVEEIADDDPVEE